MSKKGINQKPFKYYVGQHVKTNTGSITIKGLEREYIPNIFSPHNHTNKIIYYKCDIDGYEDKIPEYSLNKGVGCKLCGKSRSIPNYNTINILYPERIKWFKDPLESYLYTTNSDKYTDFICQVCGTIIYNKNISYMMRQENCLCDLCKDTKILPLGEKYIMSLLRELNIEFYHDKSTEWSKHKRYDFILPRLRMIIETHGIQHYNQSFSHKPDDIILTKENDKYKRNLAKENGIEYYYEIDCKESDIKLIKERIIDSGLLNILNPNNLVIDWDKIYKETCSPISQKILDMWNNGQKTIKNISSELNISKSTVTRYLKHFAKIGLCEYDPKLASKGFYVPPENRAYSNTKSVICLDTLDIFERVLWACRWCGTKKVLDVCKGRRKHAGRHPETNEKLSWMYLDEYLKINNIEDTDSFIKEHTHEPVSTEYVNGRF